MPLRQRWGSRDTLKPIDPKGNRMRNHFTAFVVCLTFLAGYSQSVPWEPLERLSGSGAYNLAMSTTGALFVTIEEFNPNLIYVSEDEGGSWHQARPIPVPGTESGYTVSPLTVDKHGNLIVGIDLLGSTDTAYYYQPANNVLPSPGDRIIDFFGRTGDNGKTWEVVAFDTAMGFAPKIRRYTALSTMVPGQYCWPRKDSLAEVQYDTFYLCNQNLPYFSPDSTVQFTTRDVVENDVRLTQVVLTGDKGKTWLVMAQWSTYGTSFLFNYGLITAITPSGLFFYGSRGGIYRTANGGKSWDLSINGIPCSYGYKICGFGPQGEFYTQDNHGIAAHFSTDNGASWRALDGLFLQDSIYPGSPSWGLDVEHANGKTYAWIGTELRISSDGGSSWIERSPGFWVYDFKVDVDGHIFAVLPLHCFISTDDGVTWHGSDTTENTLFTFYCGDYMDPMTGSMRYWCMPDQTYGAPQKATYHEVLPVADGTLYWLTWDRLFRSPDLGHIWEIFSPMELPEITPYIANTFHSLTHIQSTSDGILFMSTENSVLRSMDKGATWECVYFLPVAGGNICDMPAPYNNALMTPTLIDDLFVSENDFVYTAGCFGMVRSIDKGVTWQDFAGGIRGPIRQVRQNANGYLFAANERDLFRMQERKPPQLLAMTSPSDGAHFGSGETVPVSAAFLDSASDHEGTIVRFYAHEVLIGEDSTAPYGISWETAGDGTYLVQAIAFDQTGSTMSSDAVRIGIGDSHVLGPRLRSISGNSTIAVISRSSIAIQAPAKDLYTIDLLKPDGRKIESSVVMGPTVLLLPSGNLSTGIYLVRIRSKTVTVTRPVHIIR
jgi:hypothetical protein